MHLRGSCHCGRVEFELESDSPWPYQLCYCSICRKTGGGGGYMINIGGDHRTLQVRGEEFLGCYRAMIGEGAARGPSGHHRYFCRECGAHLYAWHRDWPELVHPVASAIDTPLPKPPALVHLMVGSKASWVPIELHEEDETFDEYPELSLSDWHAAHGWREPA